VIDVAARTVTVGNRTVDVVAAAGTAISVIRRDAARSATVTDRDRDLVAA
jgi:hypothetical protein